MSQFSTSATEQANCQITGVSFRLFEENEAKRLSSLSIANPQTFDPLGHPIDTGLADTALGIYFLDLIWVLIIEYSFF